MNTETLAVSLGERPGGTALSKRRLTAITAVCMVASSLFLVWREGGKRPSVAIASPTVTPTVSQGGQQACVVNNVGTAKCWGSDDNSNKPSGGGKGGLGDGDLTYTDRYTPVEVSRNAGPFKAVSAGQSNNGCGIAFDGSLWCWGDNSFGQLGISETGSDLANSPTPVQVTGLAEPATAVSAGADQVCAVTASGRVKCWGWNGFGQLGAGHVSIGGNAYYFDSAFPEDVIGIPSTETVVSVSAAYAFTCAVAKSGNAYCWGWEGYGELGNGYAYNAYSSDTATPVLFPSGETATAISAGYQHACAVMSSGGVDCWGYNASGELGQGNNISGSNAVDTSHDTPGPALRPWGGGVSAVMISAGSTSSGSGTSCAVTSDAAAWCWGGGDANAVSGGSSTQPVQVDGLSPGTTSGISAGASATCAVLVSGGVKCWGDNSSGQLGDGTTTNRSEPVDVMTPVRGLSSLTAGGSHTCSLDGGGAARCWGNNGSGQLGDASTTTRTVPSPVAGVSQGAMSISAGGSHTCAVAPGANGPQVALCWGDNTDGQLGVSNTSSASSPVAVEGFGGTPSAISAGANHTCALTAPGGVECWGLNAKPATDQTWLGGVATNVNHQDNHTNQPQTVTSVPTATAVSAGGNHTCALTTSGAVDCWGDNRFGQLGTAPGGYSDSAVQVPAVPPAASISAGSNHSCALTLQSTLWCWGDNSQGQLGNGTAAPAPAPVEVNVDGATVTSVAAGGNHTCAITSGQKVYCWGDGVSSPNVVGLPGFVPVGLAAGASHTCALLNFMAVKGMARCWGSNSNGQLGDANTSDSTTPVDVVSGPFSAIEPTVRVSVSTAGAGGGVVVSDPAVISCQRPAVQGQICQASFIQYSQVTLTASPDAFSVFDGWTAGPCSGTAPTCAFSADSPRNVTAAFHNITNPLQVHVTGTGEVSSDPPGITCPATCTAGFQTGTAVTLTASTPAAHNVFDSWSGDCAGVTSTVCHVTVDSDQGSAGATFNYIGKSFIVIKPGTGQGLVTSDPPGISCGQTCSAVYDPGSVVTLTAQSGANSSFSYWSDACSGTGATCTLSTNTNQRAQAWFALTTATVTVIKQGTGHGHVLSSPPGIDCGPSCRADYPVQTQVTLTASADQSSIFTGWRGACSGTSPTCTVTMDSPKTADPVFEAMTHTVSVSLAGPGQGRVTSDPGGIICGSACVSSFPSGSMVTLTATPGSGSVLTGWSGACSGTGPCVITVSSDQTATATFGIAGPGVTVSRQGNGQGSVYSEPSGIDCGQTCNSSFPQGSQVTLTAVPAPGSTFAGWSGNCSGRGACTLSIDSPKAANATFAVVMHKVSVLSGGSGSGSIESDPAGISCGQACSHYYPQGQAVTLTAVPSQGSTFGGWSGACSGTGMCALKADQDRLVGATFQVASSTAKALASPSPAAPRTLPPQPVARPPVANGPPLSYLAALRNGARLGKPPAPPPAKVPLVLPPASLPSPTPAVPAHRKSTGFDAGLKAGDRGPFILGKTNLSSGHRYWRWTIPALLIIVLLAGAGLTRGRLTMEGIRRRQASRS